MCNHDVSRRLLTRLAIITGQLIGILCLPCSVSADAPRDADRSRKIRGTLAEVVAKEQIPGMMAAIADAQGVIAIGSAGVRKMGSDIPLTDADLVHVGSCTKAMTSAMLATLVADGTLAWDTTLIEVLPELKSQIHPEYHAVTLWQLVTHRARLPANAKDWWVHRNLEITNRRLAILKDNLKQAPTVGPGQYTYSNLGYVAAACLAEKATGSTWEILMRKRLFEPLGMKSAGFGPPGAADKVNQPWGHLRSDSKWTARHFDNAEALGPAGRVHCTLADWAKSAALQLPDSRVHLLSRKQLDQLITPTGDYAAGWIVVRRQWAAGQALVHSGSNTMWYATVWVAPRLNRTFMVATNSCADRSHAICDRVIAKLIEIDQQPSRN